MFRALATAASGMEAEQTKLDVTANNIANSSTNGFKRSRAEFADLMYQTTRSAGAATGSSTYAPSATEVGLGTRLVSTMRDQAQGTIQQTGGQLDVAIQGKGYLKVQLPDGSSGYTRNGALQLNAEGKIVTSDGNLIEGDFSVPPDASSISIAANGQITAVVPSQAQPVNVGTLQLATFANPGGLAAEGTTMFRETSASGTAVLGPPGEGGSGTLLQGSLETSNVNVVQEMVDLIAGQRAYEVNSRVVKADDEMLQETAQLQ